MMEKTNIRTTITLNNGISMPMFGLGTFQSPSGKETRSAVRWALEAGYRHIDTAALYGNEEDVGQAIHESGVPREEIFLTTKLWNAEHRSALQAFDDSLRKLNTDYVDLYLVHWPLKDTHLEAWKNLVKIYESGRARAVGVSNYTPIYLDEVLQLSELVPAVNQFEISPFLTRQALVDYCASHGIQVESYSPLARGKKWDDPVIAGLAESYGKSPAQVMIRWALDKGFVVIPKSVHRERIIENSQVFDFSLTPEEVQRLDGLNENLHTINPPWMRDQWE
jgi:diketogulonate reductase-like aldo/keto reductase